eukprot:CAMPEP_0174311488 /NCGR_PEP_ID=MMETSP0810-20121108/3735_1 /TAXON_ID=73025 ORGANISM="Eutreptiella gymnastica-like, Strain CCMP1594" /NCGR_SAMPLE_ID=MMETSP0810 /ASSEMBLY_ACC=CAM_ASM_000659 /LENGTH=156 /DNA_ID=CAMNT_0015419721 /DNA_START=873 /DNA_END=1344 /DNA_ORIENTATION=+
MGEKRGAEEGSCGANARKKNTAAGASQAQGHWAAPAPHRHGGPLHRDLRRDDVLVLDAARDHVDADHGVAAALHRQVAGDVVVLDGALAVGADHDAVDAAGLDFVPGDHRVGLRGHVHAEGRDVLDIIALHQPLAPATEVHTVGAVVDLVVLDYDL